MSLNQVDRQILALLQQDASLSTAEIADKVGLSQSPCWRRIAKPNKRPKGGKGKRKY